MICRGTFTALSLSVVIVGCSDAPRDPRLDESNIFAAAEGIYGGGYDAFLAKKKEQYEAAALRESQAQQDNLVLSEGLSRQEAKRRALNNQVSQLRSSVSGLERSASRVRAQSQEARAKQKVLDQRRAALDAEADRILANDGSGNAEQLERDLAKAQAENRLLLEEYEGLTSN